MHDTDDRGAALARDFSLANPPPGFIDHPAPFWAALRRHAPVHRLDERSVYLTAYDDVLAVYRSAAVSSDKQQAFAPVFGTGAPLYAHHTTSLVFNDPPRHTRVRRILMGALNQRAIARMEAGVKALVDDLLDVLAGEPAPDLIAHFAAQIPVEVIGNLLAIPRGDRGPLRGWSLAILSALEPAPSAAVQAAGNAAVTEFLDYLRMLVAERRAQPGDPEVDVLTRLMLGDAEGALDEAELMHNCIFLLNAGHETTTNLIGNGALLLMTHRDQLARLLAEPALINPAVEELLRLESPIQINNRLTTEAVPLPSGTTLPAGTFVHLAIGAANRDPAVFADPDRLDITRSPNHHLAFGQGAHACSGMNVARMEARIALGRLFQRFPRLAPDGEPVRDRRLRFRGFSRLPVRLG
ncbi:cytochrome P450 [Rubrivivax albus]|uniref:Cytochrome P450 n=1 Tax=Rubrivivax albus TaxID=2499835 RepID=A0A437JUB1_9BURK|nr:cytochrome P450 [Rubrivivax albus]RVT50818.1 cytochrome P450 [Rubrivivax albus]